MKLRWSRQAQQELLVVPEHSPLELREVLVRSYRIVYTVGVDAIEVLTVFDGHHLFPKDVVPDALDDDG